MIGFKIDKSMFFDRQKVVDATDRASRRVLSRFAAFVRQRARTSIRKRKGTSAPGGPPHSHVGLLRRFIFFGYDPRKRSVVIGPTALSNSNGEAPSLLEYGGTARIRDPRNPRSGRRRTARFRERPYMGPALEAEQPKLPSMWRNSINPRK
ncbi:MAG: hypothetical protein AAF711_00350 [Planctomycetota bacterium]